MTSLTLIRVCQKSQIISHECEPDSSWGFTWQNERAEIGQNYFCEREENRSNWLKSLLHEDTLSNRLLFEQEVEKRKSQDSFTEERLSKKFYKPFEPKLYGTSKANLVKKKEKESSCDMDKKRFLRKVPVSTEKVQKENIFLRKRKVSEISGSFLDDDLLKAYLWS